MRLLLAFALLPLLQGAHAESTEWDRHVTPEDKLHDCGLRDRCPENATTIQSTLMSPEICRCDPRECRRFGDCCWSLMENRTLAEEPNLWRCGTLEVQNTSTTFALMVSECPASSRDVVTNQFCSGLNIPPQNYTYLLDLPVYSNKSEDGAGVLYKNIYCARCHGERSSHIVPWSLQLACSHQFTPQERAEFMSTARYVPGERLWRGEAAEDGAETPTPKCALKVAELREFEIEINVPNVRYCPDPARTISSCPDAPSTEESEPAKISKLCSSYAQYVMNRETGQVYKNPHCARCHEGADAPLSCRRPSVATTFFKVRPGEAGAILPGAGLNFLFDFGLGGNKYVGYDMLCGDDEIWDYIRQRCGPMICRSGYKLVNGNCIPGGLPGSVELIEIRPNSTGEDGGEFPYNRTIEIGADDDPDCTKYRILLHFEDREYENLEEPLGAIAILLGYDASTAEEPPEILLASEYERLNATTVSVCAKFLHHAFRATFSPALNTVSLISVGLSVLFSGLHLLLFLILPKLRNPPGRNLFCLTLSLFTFQLLFLTLVTHDRWPSLCIGAAIVQHYFALAAFFWMSVMSFDMWRTFSCNSLLRRSHSTDSQKFAKYSAYAWTAPALIVGTALVLDFGVAPPAGGDDDALLSTVRPSYGENGLCWITQRLSLFIFFAVPVAAVISVNILLFSFTANAIFSQQRESSRVFNNRSPKKVVVTPDPSSAATNGASPTTPKKSAPTQATNRDKVRLMLYVNMALIMGLGWILGFASQFLATDWLRYPFVVVNGLQGAFIFFAFDFKWKIWRMLRDGKIGKALGLERATSSTGLADTSTSAGGGGGGGRKGTRSSNLLSTSSAAASESEKRRKISLSLK